jgi:type II restriction/modification system DNA methylase subunit YeeA
MGVVQISEVREIAASHSPDRDQGHPRITPQEFYERWKPAALSERSAAQSHFNDICALIGEKTPVEADPQGTWFTFEKGASKVGGSRGWADVWKKGCFAWEYKRKGKDLTDALTQLQRYAIALDNPPLLVVSDIETIIIHTNFNNSIHHEHRITLEDLRTTPRPAVEKLKNLFTSPPYFDSRVTTVSVTKQAAEAFASIAQLLRKQGYEGRRVAHFMTKLIFCLFAEDIRALPDKVFTRAIESAERHPEKFAGKMKTLFAAMQRGGEYGYIDIPWFNGGLFDDDDALPLDREAVRLILQASLLDWSQIEPSIFGTLFERGLDPDNRSQIGAHYTDEASIRLIIEPVIKEPLEADWEKTKREIEALLAQPKPKREKKARKEAQELYDGFLRKLVDFRVLDAGCGSGNFLYVALMVLKDLEHRVQLDGEIYGFQRSFYQVGPKNLLGIEVNDYAAELARLTIWIGEIQWRIKNGAGVPKEPVLQRLEQIETRDALVTPDGKEAAWPAADCIIGNPPFLGDKKMIAALGETYVQEIRGVYAGLVPGGADLVTYWFEKARKAIEEGHTNYVGLVATNSIRQKGNRGVLERIRHTGKIYRAWADKPWVNDGAAVRVSVVCFSARNAELPIRLENQEVHLIHSDLTGGEAGALDITKARRLAENKNCSFFGLCLAGRFAVPGDLARRWLMLPNPHCRPNSDVLRPIWNGIDVLKGHKDRWVIDFGVDMVHEEAALYEAPFAHVVEQVRPARLKNREAIRAEKWWRLGRPRPELRKALEGHNRYIATVETAKHRVFAWFPVSHAPEHNLIVIPRSDDVTLGILSCRYHSAWALAAGGRLGVGNDPRYNSTRCFETFPFPAGLTPNVLAERYLTNPRARKIAAASQELVNLRENWLRPPEWVKPVPEVVPGFPDRVIPVNEDAAQQLRKRTLTNLYNLKPQWLLQAHRKLDEAVAAAYRWPVDIPDEEALHRLLELNRKRSIAAVARPEGSKGQKPRDRKPRQPSFMFTYAGGKTKEHESFPADTPPTAAQPKKRQGKQIKLQLNPEK